MIDRVGGRLELGPGTGELVLSHLRTGRRLCFAFRTRDHVGYGFRAGAANGRECAVRADDDMMIVRGVNVFPSASRVVGGSREVRAKHGNRAAGVKQEPPLPVSVELTPNTTAEPELAEAIRERLRNVLVVQTRVDLVRWGSLQRSEYKSKLVEH